MLINQVLNKAWRGMELKENNHRQGGVIWPDSINPQLILFLYAGHICVCFIYTAINKMLLMNTILESKLVPVAEKEYSSNPSVLKTFLF